MISQLLRLSIIAAAVAVAVVIGAAGPLPVAHAVFEDTDGDGAIDIAEQVSGSDENDPDSIPENTATELLTSQPVCSDGTDNDGDGLVDSADIGCHDTDHDLFPDDIEQHLGSNPNDPSSTVEDSRVDLILAYYFLPISFCADGVDNDHDGLTDAADPACHPADGDGDGFDDAIEKIFGSDPANAASMPEHEQGNPGSCADGIDNDLDGLVDDADTGCGAPPNDDRVNAAEITALPYSDGPTVVKNATHEAGEPRPSCSYGGPSIWYRYTAPQDGVLIADTGGSAASTALAVWQEAGSHLTQVDCSNGGYLGPLPQPNQVRVAFRVSAGESYFFQIVPGGSGSAGLTLPTVRFHVEQGTPPLNDSYSALSDIASLPFEDSADTSAATTQFGEPRPTCTEQPRSTVWYRYTPAQDAVVIADTLGTDYGAFVALWTDSKFGLAQLDCAGGYSFFSGGAQPGRLLLRAQAGQHYYFQLGSPGELGGAFGNLVFHLAEGIPPNNDNFADATGVTGLPFSEDADMLTATLEPNEPHANCLPDAVSSVWYRYTADHTGYLEAGVESGSFLGEQLAVYRGDAIDALTQVACSRFAYSPFGSEAGFHAAAGETFYFQIASFGIGAPFGGLGVQGSAPQPPALAPGKVTFELDNLAVPACPTAQVHATDPTGDATPSGPGGPISPPQPTDPPLDITSIAGGSDGTNYCVRVQFAAPLPAPDSAPVGYASVGFDTGDASTDVGGACAVYRVENGLSFLIPSNVLVPIFFGPIEIGAGSGPPEEEQYAFVLFGERSFTLVVPLKALGSGPVHFAVSVESAGGSDCAPDASMLPPLESPGDVSCDGRVNSIDSALILQFSAGVIPALPCQSAGDLDQSGSVGAVDASLILQYSAGMLAALPVA